MRFILIREHKLSLPGWVHLVESKHHFQLIFLFELFLELLVGEFGILDFLLALCEERSAHLSVLLDLLHLLLDVLLADGLLLHLQLDILDCLVILVDQLLIFFVYLVMLFKVSCELDVFFLYLLNLELPVVFHPTKYDDGHEFNGNQYEEDYLDLSLFMLNNLRHSFRREDDIGFYMTQNLEKLVRGS